MPRQSEEAAYVRDLRASRRRRAKKSREWTNLKKARAKKRVSRDDGVYRKQATLGEELNERSGVEVSEQPNDA